MMVAGMLVTDADSRDAAADILDEIEESIECPECRGKGDIWDVSGGAGWINISCPCCGGEGSIIVNDWDEDDDPEPPMAVAPAVVLVPVYRCARCRDTGRAVKASAWFPGETTVGFCPDCTRHYDFATRRIMKPAA